MAHTPKLAIESLEETSLSVEAKAALTTPEILAKQITFDYAPVYDTFGNPDFEWFRNLGGREYSSNIYVGDDKIGHYTATYLPNVKREDGSTIEEKLDVEVLPLVHVTSILLNSQVRRAAHCLARRNLLDRLEGDISPAVPVEDAEEPYVGHDLIGYLHEVVAEQADLNLLEK